VSKQKYVGRKNMSNTKLGPGCSLQDKGRCSVINWHMMSCHRITALGVVNAKQTSAATAPRPHCATQNALS
jgi:hypothetical protein